MRRYFPQNLDENRTRITAKEAGHFLAYIREELVRLPELKDNCIVTV